MHRGPVGHVGVCDIGRVLGHSGVLDLGLVDLRVVAHVTHDDTGGHVLPKWFTRPLVNGERGRDVDVVQRKLAVFSGVYDDITQAHVRGFQQKLGLECDGVVGPLTANALGEAADHALPPIWFSRDLRIGCEGEDVAGLRSSLGLTSGHVYDEETRRAVLRFQSAHSLELSGVVNAAIATRLP